MLNTSSGFVYLGLVSHFPTLRWFSRKRCVFPLFRAETYIPLQFSHEFPYTNITRYTVMDVKNKQNKTLCCKQYETWKYKNPITHYIHTELYYGMERRRCLLRENSFIKKNLCFIHIIVIDPNQPSRLFYSVSDRYYDDNRNIWEGNLFSYQPTGYAQAIFCLLCYVIFGIFY